MLQKPWVSRNNTSFLHDTGANIHPALSPFPTPARARPGQLAPKASLLQTPVTGPKAQRPQWSLSLVPSGSHAVDPSGSPAQPRCGMKPSPPRCAWGYVLGDAFGLCSGSSDTGSQHVQAAPQGSLLRFSWKGEKRTEEKRHQCYPSKARAHAESSPSEFMISGNKAK